MMDKVTDGSTRLARFMQSHTLDSLDVEWGQRGQVDLAVVKNNL